MLLSGLFVVTALLYAVSCGLYLVHLVRGSKGYSSAANRLLGLSAVTHFVFLVVGNLLHDRLPFGDIYRTLSLVSLLTVLAFLLLELRHPVSVLGAFITPVTLLFFLGSGLGTSVAPVSDELRSALLPVHVGVNLLGIVAFALAFAAAIAYVLQERLVRRKKLSGVFQRLPALDVLDSIGLRAVVVGFPLLTIGIVTGTFWATRMQHGGVRVAPEQSFAVLAWLVFAGVLLLRVSAGWRGRRAAIGTIMGFLCAAAVLVGYVIRAGMT